jgi:hypothetical protein
LQKAVAAWLVQKTAREMNYGLARPMDNAQARPAMHEVTRVLARAGIEPKNGMARAAPIVYVVGALRS